MFKGVRACGAISGNPERRQKCANDLDDTVDEEQDRHERLFGVSGVCKQQDKLGEAEQDREDKVRGCEPEESIEFRAIDCKQRQ